ncbi:MAG TPA: protein translocase subunit SecF, partial [Nocardioides sp.]|nr:protein translocase subunit SecF [Nocardioides sp.]
ALADRYAAVPVFKDDEPVVPRDAAGVGDDDPAELVEVDEVDATDARSARTPVQGAVGKGRNVPAPTRPVNDSGSAGRKQPQRQTRSKRGKK